MTNRINQFIKTEYKKYTGSTDNKLLDSDTIYVHKNIVFYLCPCGCGREVVIPTRKDQKTDNCWLVSKNDEKITLSPSINMNPGTCESHYFVKNNNIDWC